MNTQDPVLFKQIKAKHGQIGIITLNRPQALNALNLEMVQAISAQLHVWTHDPEIAVVIIIGTGRAFCAGGDLKEIYKRNNNNSTTPFYSDEYLLNLLINKFPKPYIAILNGIAMGGGLGLALHGTRVIATEKLQLAMPEVAIGFFPDVGAAKFLSKCPKHIGTYLGLTGNTIGVADALYAQLIDAYIPSSKFDELLNDLTSFDLTNHALTLIDGLITRHEKTTESCDLAKHADIIERCFNKYSVSEIIQALQAEKNEWADAQIQILLSRCPTSLCVTLRMLRIGANMSLVECLAQELKLAKNLMQRSDFYEGIRAVLIDKTNDPKWQPATLQELNHNDINKLFD